MRRNARWVVLLAGAGAVLGTAVAQNNNAAAQARAAAASPAPNFASSPREKLVVAMPKTYERAETMLLWGDYFNHLARCGNLDLQNQHGESLERSSNIDLLVASRTIIWSLVKQMRVCLIPLFHRLHRRTALER